MSRNKTRKRAIAKSNKKMRLARERDIERLGLSYTFHEVAKKIKISKQNCPSCRYKHG